MAKLGFAGHGNIKQKNYLLYVQGVEKMLKAKYKQWLLFLEFGIIIAIKIQKCR